VSTTEPVGNTSIRVNGTLTVRPIEIVDVERLERMFRRLSRESVYFRFFSPLGRVPRSTLQRLADVDHSRRDALVALDGDEIVAMAGYQELTSSGRSGTRDAEIAVTVEDDWQHRGVGRRLVADVAVLARERGFDAFVATILPDNRAALGLMRELVPDASVRFEGGAYSARLPLTAGGTVRAA
jgi:GNAT superfamily N-acetyltransferase